MKLKTRPGGFPPGCGESTSCDHYRCGLKRFEMTRRIIWPVVMPCRLAASSSASTCQRGNNNGSSTTSESDDNFGPVYEPTSWESISDSAVNVGIKGITAWSVNRDDKVVGLAPDHNGNQLSNSGAQLTNKTMLCHNSLVNRELGKSFFNTSAMFLKRIDAMVAQFAIVFTDLSAVRTFPVVASSPGRFRIPQHRRRLSFPSP